MTDANEVRERVFVLCRRRRRHRQLDYGAFRKGQGFRGLEDAANVSGFDGRGHALRSAIVPWESDVQYTGGTGDCEVELKGT